MICSSYTAKITLLYMSLYLTMVAKKDHPHAVRDEPILLFFLPIFLSGNSFIFNLFF